MKENEGILSKEGDISPVLKEINARLNKIFSHPMREQHFEELVKLGLINKFFPWLEQDQIDALPGILHDMIANIGFLSLNHVYALFVRAGEYGRQATTVPARENPLIKINFETYKQYLEKLPNSPNFKRAIDNFDRDARKAWIDYYGRVNKIKSP